MQLGNLLATRTRRLSILQQPPVGNSATSNYWLFPAGVIAIGVGTLFSYIPGIQNVFGTRGVPVKVWFIPLSFALGILVLDELRKLVVRTYPKSLLAKAAW